MKPRKLIPKKRRKPRRVEQTPEEIDAARLAVYKRSGGRCELNLGPKCIKGVLPFKGNTPWDHGHFVHIKAKSTGGKYSEENGYWGCCVCHLGYHHTQGIPLPTKSKQGEVNDDTKIRPE